MKQYSQFHDGYLDGLWIEGATVHVYLSTLEKEQFVIVAKGVIALSASEFRAGNIIFEVVMRDHDEIVPGDVAELYDLQQGPAGEVQGTQLLEKARQEGLTLLEISPSYGATCLVLADRIDLLERSKWLEQYLMRAG